SANVFLMATPDVHGYRFTYRPTAGGSTVAKGTGIVAYPNTWVRLQRQGDLVVGYRSVDGQNWVMVASARLTLPNTVYFGQAVTGVDVGGSTPAGSTHELVAGRDYDVTGGGADIYGTADQFQFAYRQQTGDFDVKVRIHALDQQNIFAKAGLMARAGLGASAQYVGLLMMPIDKGFRFQSRTTDAAITNVTSATATAFVPDSWVRLK